MTALFRFQHYRFTGLIPLLVCMSSVYYCNAQYYIPENSNWAFGQYAGISLSSGTPAAFTSAFRSSNYAAWEAAASISDAAGQLLFYTNGEVIWNRNHLPMPNAHTLHGGPPPGNTTISITGHASQGTCIVPFPDSTGMYYVFSLTNSWLNTAPGRGRLFYSVVDIRLNGGLGDVVAGRKWIPIDTGLSEKMIAIPGTCNNVWLLVHSNDTNRFKAYEITRNGIRQTPVISYAGHLGRIISFGRNEYWLSGGLAVSHDNKKVAMCNTQGRTLELFNFDNSTGEILPGTFIVDIQSRSWDAFYSACFSPDNNLLYATSTGDEYPPAYLFLYQYDLTSNDSLTIRNSRQTVTRCGNMNELATPLAMGRDGRIYFQDTVSDRNVLGVIEYPNIPGTGSSPQHNLIQFLPGSYMSMGLTNLVAKAVADTTYINHTATAVCPGSDITLRPSPGMYHFIWNDGSTDSIKKVTQAGIYYVSGSVDCGWRMDSFTVYETPVTFSLGPDTIICDGSPYRLEVQVPGATYLWQNGSTSNYFEVHRSGRYWLRLSLNGCIYSDTIQIGIQEMQPVSLGPDTVICDNRFFHAGMSIPGASYQWNTGSTDSVLRISESGTYILRVDQNGCIASDTIRIETLPAPEAQITADRPLCPGTEPELSVSLAPGLTYNWNTGAVTPSVRITGPGTYFVTVVAENGCVAEDSILVEAIYPPEIDMPTDTFLCTGKALQLNPVVRYPDITGWSDGYTSVSRKITESGSYTLHVSNSCGAATATVVITNNSCELKMPDAFTPNGDGRNDVFRIPPNLLWLEEPVRLRIFNRWGEQVFEGNTKQSGWDGNHKDYQAPAGIYMYLLEYEQYGKRQHLKGDLHLIR